MAEAEFDAHAERYNEELNEALSVSGEDRDFFARGRVAWFADCARRMGALPKSVLNYGCGTGVECPLLLDLLKVERVWGVDVSAQSIEVATRERGSDSLRFHTLEGYSCPTLQDAAYCNGVFHHIPVAERHGALRFIHSALRPGGLFAFWENNPWNVGTRYVMSRCAFDGDAITISMPEACGLLQKAGFQVLRKDSLFYFPRQLKWLRGLEPALRWLPLGGQYQVLCRKDN